MRPSGRVSPLVALNNYKDAKLLGRGEQELQLSLNAFPEIFVDGRSVIRRVLYGEKHD
jgi:hypothetical protein